MVSGGTTVNHVLQVLSASGLIPLKTENLYISTSRARRLGNHETMASFGAGNLTHLYLRSSFFGGSGVVISSAIHRIKFHNFLQISEPLESTDVTKTHQDPDQGVP